MIIDIPQERGMASVDSKFDENIQTCRFPYINSLQPMTADNMTLVYLALFISQFYDLYMSLKMSIIINFKQSFINFSITTINFF